MSTPAWARPDQGPLLAQPIPSGACCHHCSLHLRGLSSVVVTRWQRPGTHGTHSPRDVLGAFCSPNCSDEFAHAHLERIAKAMGYPELGAALLKAERLARDQLSAARDATESFLDSMTHHTWVPAGAFPVER